MQLKVIIVHFSAVTCSKTIFRQGVTSEPHLEFVFYKMPQERH